ncbi:UNVERIFIED_CONTAM: hypothetical protein GTU68_016521 [Idotea baltica]|nr:hypothetical protein [Idotea baltica]
MKAVSHATALEVVTMSIFGVSLVLLYTSSTLYHAMHLSKHKRHFQVLDHGFIFVLIAGTYTPLVLGPLRSPIGWALFGIVWGLAILGFVLKAIYLPHYAKPTSFLYLVMGWLIVFAAREISENLSPLAIRWLVAGGLCYSIGIIFFILDRIKYMHAVWHLFVLAGSICHFFAVFYGVIQTAK